MIRIFQYGVMMLFMVKAWADEGPTFLDGNWRGKGAVIRDGAMTLCPYVLSRFKVAHNSYAVAFKRRCFSPQGQPLVDQKIAGTSPTPALTASDYVVEPIPEVTVEAKDGKFFAGDTVVGTYTTTTADILYEVPMGDAKYVWHGSFKLIGSKLISQEDAVTTAKDKSQFFNIVYAGVMERDFSSPDAIAKELEDPN